jgi:hypothetical protein
MVCAHDIDRIDEDVELGVFMTFILFPCKIDKDLVKPLYKWTIFHYFLPKKWCITSRIRMC